MARIPLLASLILLAGCTGAPEPATLVIATSGNPPIERGFDGYRIEAALEGDARIVGTWEPARRPSVSVDPGDYTLAIVYRSVSDVIMCTADGPNPTCNQQTGNPIVLCRIPVSLAADAEVRLAIDLSVVGPDCHVATP